MRGGITAVDWLSRGERVETTRPPKRGTAVGPDSAAADPLSVEAAAWALRWCLVGQLPPGLGLQNASGMTQLAQGRGLDMPCMDESFVFVEPACSNSQVVSTLEVGCRRGCRHGWSVSPASFLASLPPRLPGLRCPRGLVSLISCRRAVWGGQTFGAGLRGRDTGGSQQGAPPPLSSAADPRPVQPHAWWGRWGVPDDGVRTGGTGETRSLHAAAVPLNLGVCLEMKRSASPCGGT